MGTEIEDHIVHRYDIKKRLGKGAYGIVWKVVDKKSKQVLALKKIFDAFRNKTDAQRTFREIMFLQAFGNHPNIIRLFNVLQAYNNKDIYLVFEFMETDLHNVIKKGNILQNIHIRYIMYQLFKATKYLHSGNVIHRDLKPSNVLLNSDCHVKMCDFGLARSLSQIPTDEEGSPNLTEYIATRWYRAPEILLASHKYTFGIDQWSLGCILGEMFLGKPLFPGSSTLNQLERIMSVIDKPSETDIDSMQSDYGATVNQTTSIVHRSFNELFPTCDKDGFTMLKQLLQFNPDKRLTPDQALRHPFVIKFHKPSEEISIGFDVLPMFNDAVQLSLDEYRNKLYELIAEGKLEWDQTAKMPSHDINSQVSTKDAILNTPASTVTTDATIATSNTTSSTITPMTISSIMTTVVSAPITTNSTLTETSDGDKHEDTLLTPKITTNDNNTSSYYCNNADEEINYFNDSQQTCPQHEISEKNFDDDQCITLRADDFDGRISSNEDIYNAENQNNPITITSNNIITYNETDKNNSVSNLNDLFQNVTLEDNELNQNSTLHYQAEHLEMKKDLNDGNININKNEISTSNLLQDLEEEKKENIEIIQNNKHQGVKSCIIAKSNNKKIVENSLLQVKTSDKKQNIFSTKSSSAAKVIHKPPSTLKIQKNLNYKNIDRNLQGSSLGKIDKTKLVSQTSKIKKSGDNKNAPHLVIKIGTNNMHTVDNLSNNNNSKYVNKNIHLKRYDLEKLNNNTSNISLSKKMLFNMDEIVIQQKNEMDKTKLQSSFPIEKDSLKYEDVLKKNNGKISTYSVVYNKNAKQIQGDRVLSSTENKFIEMFRTKNATKNKYTATYHTNISSKKQQLLPPRHASAPTATKHSNALKVESSGSTNFLLRRNRAVSSHMHNGSKISNQITRIKSSPGLTKPIKFLPEIENTNLVSVKKECWATK